MFLRKLSLSDGFSVTELLIALALAAILLALAAPNFRSFLVNNRTKTQADSFLMMMYQARQRGIEAKCFCQCIANRCGSRWS